MRQTLVSSFALVAVFAALFGAGPGRVMACSCAGIQPTEQAAREMVEYSDLIVVGSVIEGSPIGAAPTPHADSGITPDPAARTGQTRATIDVEYAYGGVPPAVLVVQADDGGGGCGYGASLQQGGRHFMALTEQRDGSGAYYASYCSSFPMAQADAPRDEYERGYAAFLDVLAGIAPPVEAPLDLDDEVFRRYVAYLASLGVLDAEDDGTSATMIGLYVAGSLVALGALFVVGSRMSRGRGRS